MDFNISSPNTISEKKTTLICQNVYCQRGESQMFVEIQGLFQRWRRFRQIMVILDTTNGAQNERGRVRKVAFGRVRKVMLEI